MNARNLDHKKNIERCFSRSAHRYDAAADFQHQVGNVLIASLSSYGLNPTFLADIGSGTSMTTQALTQALPSKKIYCIDLSLAMLQIGRTKPLPASFITADFDQLPFRNEAFDVVFSNMTLQWSLKLKQTLSEWLRCLMPGGLLAVSLLVDGTFSECPGFLNGNPFYSTFEIKKLLFDESVSILLFEEKAYFRHYSSQQDLIHFFKNTGSNYLFNGGGHRYLSKAMRNALSQPLPPVAFNVLYFILKKSC